jgi:hypothetical protein
VKAPEGNKHRRRRSANTAPPTGHRAPSGAAASQPEPAAEEAMVYGRDLRSVHPVVRRLFASLNARPYQVRLAIWRRCIAIEERATGRKLHVAKRKDGIHPVRAHARDDLRQAGPRLDDETSIAILKFCAKELKTEVLTGPQYREWALKEVKKRRRKFQSIPISTYPYSARFGSWEAACETAGLMCGTSTDPFDSDELIEVLELTAKWIGRIAIRLQDVQDWAASPGGKEYAATHRRGIPKSTGPFVRVFESWNNALAEAGLLPARMIHAVSPTGEKTGKKVVVETRAMSSMKHRSDEEMLNLVRDASAANGGGYITRTRYNQHRRKLVTEARKQGVVLDVCEAALVVQRFDRSWGEVMYRAGLIDDAMHIRMTQRGDITDDDCIQAALVTAAKFGSRISERRYSKWRDREIPQAAVEGRRIPVARTIATRFGTGNFKRGVRAIVKQYGPLAPEAA